MFKGLMTSVSGIRGIIGEGMTPEVAVLWSGGFGSWVKGGKVIVARDSRPTGEMISMAVNAGLTAAGCDVDDIGVTPTPVAALAVERRGAAGGIIVSASHNPQEWNALKFVRSDGSMLTANDFASLEKIVNEGPLRSVGWNQLGRINHWDGFEVMYTSAVCGLNILKLEKIKRKQLKVAFDAVNGAGSELYPRLLTAFGCRVIKINCDGSGIFPHPPEPLPENLDDLCKLVKEEQCDIGFCVDPDGDRLAVVDETGTPVGDEMTLALCVNTVLQNKPGPVVVNSLTSQVIDDIAAQYGVQCERTKVGEANVAVGMREMHAVVGGEGNGGIMLPALHYVRDAGIGMALLLNMLAISRLSVRDNVDKLPKYKMVKKSVPVGSEDTAELINRISSHYEHDQISRIDGLRIVQDEGWVQVRPSNTEPILRIFGESTDSEYAERMVAEMIEYIKEAARDESPTD